jgi:hypothetical protein
MPPPAMIIQIRGPGLVGPRIQIRGPDVTPDVVQSFEAASAGGAPVSVLMAATQAEIVELIARWPDDAEAGWIVGNTLTADDLGAAIANGDADLRILIAADVADITGLTAIWSIH